MFIHYSPLGANEIMFIGGSWEDRIARFKVDSKLECVKREYEVNFEIDNKGFLDIATATCIRTENYERESLQYPYDCVLYKNSNWENLKMTNMFRNRYNPQKGSFPDIDNINVTTGFFNGEVIDLYTFINECVYKDGTHKWYCVKFINDTNGYLDDIEFIPIDYTGTDAKKAKEIYLKSVNK